MAWWCSGQDNRTHNWATITLVSVANETKPAKFQDLFCLLIMHRCNIKNFLSACTVDLQAPSLGVCYFLSLTISPSVCHKHSFFFVFRWNRAIFWPSVLHDKNYKTVSFDFWFRPPNAQNFLPQIFICGSPSHSQYQWVIESVIVCGSTTFGLGTEIQSPTGLLCSFWVSDHSCVCCVYFRIFSRMRLWWAVFKSWRPVINGFH